MLEYVPELARQVMNEFTNIAFRKNASKCASKFDSYSTSAKFNIKSIKL